jgi:hypothetical protein
MSRRLLTLPAATLALAFAFVGCAGAAPNASPGSTGPAAASPSAPISGSAAPDATAVPGASLSPDPDLLARFPARIGDSTCENQAFTYASYLAVNPGADVLLKPVVDGFGVASDAISLGEGTCTVTSGDTEYDVDYDGTRVRGVDAGALVERLPALTAAINDEPVPVIGHATMGGRSVVTATDPDGGVTVLWASGDTIIRYHTKAEPAVDDLVVSSFPA